MTRRMVVLRVVLACLLGVTALWSYRHMARQKRLARAAAADLAECSRIAVAIGRTRRRPAMASDHERLAAETTTLIERSARSAGIAGHRLVRIAPQAPRRLGETVYREKPTRVLLKNIALRQLVVLIHSLMSADRGLNVRAIRVTAPRADDTGDRWNAEFVATYLIYDPPRLGRR